MTRKLPRSATAIAYAKVNVGWQVGERRDDGYHEICGLIQTISLADTLSFSVDEGIGVRLSVPDAPELETEDNLVMKAARVLGEVVSPRPTTITLHKSIPIAAGLGGGSADAAATLVALNVLWGARRTARQLIELGAEVGSDVPALLVGGLVHASGRGERVRNVGSFSSGALVVGISEERISAAEAYAKFDEVGGGSANDLERAALELVPALAARLDAMFEACGVAFVSGSGPTVVGVVGDEKPARDFCLRLADHFVDVRVATPSSQGVSLRLAK